MTAQIVFGQYGMVRELRRGRMELECPSIALQGGQQENHWLDG